MDEAIPLKLGYVGINNRSKKDLIHKLAMAETTKKEREFLEYHPAFKNLPPGHYGTDVSINKLTKIFFRVI